jgi:hypothetical protein
VTAAKRPLLRLIIDMPAGASPVVYAISASSGATLYHSIELDCPAPQFEGELKWMREQYGVDPSRVRRAVREWQKNSGFSHIRFHPESDDPVVVS